MKKLTIIVSALFLVMTFAISPALAKNLNVPDGQSVDYYSQAEGFIAVPANGLYTGSPATTLKIVANDILTGSLGPGRDNIDIYIQWPNSQGTINYIPLALYIATPDPAPNPDNVLDFLKTALSGFPSTITVPALGISNTKAVAENVINVERHGNSISAQLTTPQTIIWPFITGGGRPATIPAFSIELNAVGGSVHFTLVNHLSGYPGASGYTQIVEHMGFEANGALTCQAWGYTDMPMTDALVVMHGITTYIPPA